MSPSARPPTDPRTDPAVPPGMSVELLKELHLLTREGQLNADARRKLKQIRHFVGLLRPALDDALGRHPAPAVVDCGAGKSYLGFLIYELVLGPAGRGTLTAIESRPELAQTAAALATRIGAERFRIEPGTIAEASVPDRIHVVTALHACDTATDDALALGVERGADHIAGVPCCQAEVARGLAGDGPAAVAPAPGASTGAALRRDPADEALIHHPLHRRELGSHLTNVVRALCLAAHGYRVTVTELVGWEHAVKNELLLAARVGKFHRESRATLRALLERWHIQPALVRLLRARGLDPTAEV